MSLSTFLTKVKKQKIIYWEISDPDGFNSNTFLAPVQFLGRWDDVNVIFVDSKGKDTVSRAQLICNELLVVGSYVMLGTLTYNTPTNPIGLVGAVRIKQASHVPNLNGTDLFFTAMA
jgi:hypothetical protein